jgi:hypothetical protein
VRDRNSEIEIKAAAELPALIEDFNLGDRAVAGLEGDEIVDMATISPPAEATA